jgi:hypothetical protein
MRYVEKNEKIGIIVGKMMVNRWFFLDKGHLRPLLHVCLVVLPNKVELLFNCAIIAY